MARPMPPLPPVTRATQFLIATHAHKITDEDIAAAKTSGLSEDKIFEFMVCAAVG